MLANLSGTGTPRLIERYSSLPKKRDLIEDIANENLKSSVSSSIFPITFSIALGFGVSAFSGIPILGAGASLFFLHSSITSSLKKGEKIEYVKEKGILANFLSESELVKYCEIVGVDNVIEELKQASKDGQTIEGYAKRLCESRNVILKKRTIANFIQELEDLEREKVSLEYPTKETGEAETPLQGSKVSCAVEDMVKTLRSSYIAAPPRTGKGILLSLASKEFKRLYPHGIIYSYTPKQDVKENWFWTSSDNHLNPDLDNGKKSTAQSLYAMIRHWQSLPSSEEKPILFIFDELSVTISSLKSVKMKDVDGVIFAEDSQSFSTWLMDFLIHQASIRQSVHRFVWVATPLETVTESGVTASSLKSLRNYTLASRENLKFANNGNAAFSAPKIDLSHPLFVDSFSIAYSHDRQEWISIPTIQKSAIGKLMDSNPKLNMWGDLPVDLRRSAWEASDPVSVFMASYGKSFMNLNLDEEEDSDKSKFTNWVTQKLNRFPNGLTKKRLWDDSPKSIKDCCDKDLFFKWLDQAVEDEILRVREGTYFLDEREFGKESDTVK